MATLISTYSRQQITEEDIKAVEMVLRSDRLTQGPMVPRFEEALAEYVGSKYAIAVNSGTMALHLLALAMFPDGCAEVVTSPLSFVATANAFESAGCYVGFADVDRQTGNVVYDGSDPDLFVPVHFAGRACDLSGLKTRATVTMGGIVLDETLGFTPLMFGPKVVEDSCHAIGAMDFDGCSKVGSCAHSLATVFSFHPVKPITTGEGGAVTTNDEGLAQELKSLRDHGRESGLMVRLGLNGRMSDIHAALGLSQLSRCEETRIHRAYLASAYDDRLKTTPSSWYGAHHLYPIRIKGGRRDEVKAKLQARGIGVQVHYSPPIHLHHYYRQNYGYKPGAFPEAEAWSDEELSLPLHSGMTTEDVDTVVRALREVL